MFHIEKNNYYPKIFIIQIFNSETLDSLHEQFLQKFTLILKN